jgi:uncharacterized protein YpmB
MNKKIVQLIAIITVVVLLASMFSMLGYSLLFN